MNDYTKAHLLPENLCGAEDFASGAIARSAVTETCVGYGITGPGQRALERAAQVEERPCYNDVIVETHQRGHAEHADADTYRKRHSLKYLRQKQGIHSCVRTLYEISVDHFNIHAAMNPLLYKGVAVLA